MGALSKLATNQAYIALSSGERYTEPLWMVPLYYNAKTITRAEIKDKTSLGELSLQLVAPKEEGPFLEDIIAKSQDPSEKWAAECIDRIPIVLYNEKRFNIVEVHPKDDLSQETEAFLRSIVTIASRQNCPLYNFDISELIKTPKYKHIDFQRLLLNSDLPGLAKLPGSWIKAIVSLYTSDEKIAHFLNAYLVRFDYCSGDLVMRIRKTELEEHQLWKPVIIRIFKALYPHIGRRLKKKHIALCSGRMSGKASEDEIPF